jgi:hypothetical protein
MITVIARLTFKTHEDWWRWEQQRQQAGWEIMTTKDCVKEGCEELTIIEMEAGR